MTYETLGKANDLSDIIGGAEQQVLNIHELDEQSTFYCQNKENRIPIGGIRIDIPGSKAIVEVPAELKRPILNMLHGYYQDLIDEKERELEQL